MNLPAALRRGDSFFQDHKFPGFIKDSLEWPVKPEYQEETFLRICRDPNTIALHMATPGFAP
jgi:hypothetical protein